MARKFLYVIAGIIVLFLAGLFVLRLFADDLTRFIAVPTVAFAPEPPLASNAYANADLWIARPGSRDDPARFLPGGARRGAAVDAAVFFIHPTSVIDKGRWNAGVTDPADRARAELFTRGMASAFGDAAEVWVPRYRQATIGAFLTDRPAARQALDLAYGDVLNAFDWFVAHAAPGRPIVLAGHSQGALHLLRLLRDRVAGTPLAGRVAAVYVIGWPVSARHDLPPTGLPACVRADQAGCLMSWQSYAEPARTPAMPAGYPGAFALDGGARLDAPPLCTNPLTGGAAPEAPASANLGTLVPASDLKSATLTPGLVGARCAADGLLLIAPTPDLGPYVLPGNNYHLYDVPLFWANLRADTAARVAAWRQRAEAKR